MLLSDLVSCLFRLAAAFAVGVFSHVPSGVVSRSAAGAQGVPACVVGGPQQCERSRGVMLVCTPLFVRVSQQAVLGTEQSFHLIEVSHTCALNLYSMKDRNGCSSWALYLLE
jgi:hypothetical protein